MIYYIKYKNGFFSRIIDDRNNYSSTYQVYIKGKVLIFNSRSSWRGLNTVRRAVKDVIRRNIHRDYDYNTRNELYTQLEEETNQVMKDYVGYDESFPIYIKKL